MNAHNRCTDCIYAKERHMPDVVYCEKHGKFVERTRIPECYGCNYFTNTSSEKGEDK